MKIQRFVDFIAGFKDVQYALRLRHGKRQFISEVSPKDVAECAW